jgi:hypothetical protein
MSFFDELTNHIKSFFNLNCKKPSHDNQKNKCCDNYNDIYNYKYNYKKNTSKQKKYKIKPNKKKYKLNNLIVIY